MGFVVLFLHDEHGFSTGEAAAVFAAGQVLAAVLRIAVGRWSDLLGSRVAPLRWIGVVSGVALVVVAVVSGAPNWADGAAVRRSASSRRCSRESGSSRRWRSRRPSRRRRGAPRSRLPPPFRSSALHSCARLPVRDPG